MTHPVVLACMARVAEADRTSALIDNRGAVETAEVLEMLATSRKCSAHSRQVLTDLGGAP
jgi:hypothetical protein